MCEFELGEDLGRLVHFEVPMRGAASGGGIVVAIGAVGAIGDDAAAADLVLHTDESESGVQASRLEVAWARPPPVVEEKRPTNDKRDTKPIFQFHFRWRTGRAAGGRGSPSKPASRVGGAVGRREGVAVGSAPEVPPSPRPVDRGPCVAHGQLDDSR